MHALPCRPFLYQCPVPGPRAGTRPMTEVFSDPDQGLRLPVCVRAGWSDPYLRPVRHLAPHREPEPGPLTADARPALPTIPLPVPRARAAGYSCAPGRHRAGAADRPLAGPVARVVWVCAGGCRTGRQYPAQRPVSTQWHTGR